MADKYAVGTIFRVKYPDGYAYGRFIILVGGKRADDTYMTINEKERRIPLGERFLDTWLEPVTLSNLQKLYYFPKVSDRKLNLYYSTKDGSVG